MTRKPSALDRARAFFVAHGRGYCVGFLAGLAFWLLFAGLQAIGGAITDQPAEAVTQSQARK